MLPATIRSILQSSTAGTTPIQATGWIRSLRRQKNVAFLQLNDGSSPRDLQVVLGSDQVEGLDLIAGTGVKVDGLLVGSQGRMQGVELQANSIQVIGPCSHDVQKT